MVAGASYESGAFIVTGETVYFPPIQVIMYALGTATHRDLDPSSRCHPTRSSTAPCSRSRPRRD